MIQPATLPATAQLLLAIDPPGDAIGLKALETPFSVLLEANIDASLTALGGEAAPGPARAAAETPKAAPVTGKPGGKILPDRLPIAAEAMTTNADAVILPGAEAAKVEGDTVAGIALATDVPPQALLAPTLPVLITAPFATTAEPARPAPPQHPPAQPIALPPETGPALVAAPLLAPTSTPTPTPTPGQRLLARFTEALQHKQTAAPATASLPVGLIEPAPADIPAVNSLAIQPALLAQANLVPTKLSGGQATAALPAVIALLAEPEASGTSPVPPPVPPPAPPPVPVPLQAAAIGVAPLPKLAAQLPVGETRDLPVTSEPAAAIAASETGRLIAAPAALAQPEFLPQPAANTSVSAPVAPAIPAPTLAPQHDFAALIDRLVEARQAAQATLAVQTVTAAVAHAEFGQVSLQFRQDAEGLSVVMAGSDPDLARAVQAAAPAAQTATQSGNSEHPSAARQDSASQTQSQSQAQQQRGQAPQHRADDARGAANPSPRRSGPDDSSARGGIFA